MPRNVKAPLAGCLICLGGLGMVALLVYGSDSVQSLDRAMRDWLLAERGSDLESLARATAHLGDPLAMLVFLALVCLLGWIGRRRGEILAGCWLPAPGDSARWRCSGCGRARSLGRGISPLAAPPSR